MRSDDSGDRDGRLGKPANMEWLAGPAPVQEQLRRARDDLLVNGLLDSPVSIPGVRSVIERSWRRCVGDAVSPRPESIPYRDPADRQPRLREAAAPVLARLGADLAGARVAMFLSDEHGQIIMRMAAEPGQRGQLDRACAAEGFDFSEDSVGTNGLGTVVLERRPVMVHGSEHYIDPLGALTCAGTPIFEPFTRRLLGTFALTCAADEANPLMCAMATDVGRQIEGNLTAMLGAHEQFLIRSYLHATRSDHDAVLVVNERTVLANIAGLTHVDAASHALLWTHLAETVPRPGRTRTRVPLSSGWHDAVVEHVGDGPRPAYCIRLLPAVAHPGDAPGRPPARRTTGRRASPLHPVPDVHDRLATAVRFGEVLAVDGGPGTGKCHVATAALAAATAGAPLVIDLAAQQRDDGPAWLASATGALGSGRGVVLRHLQDLDEGDVNRVKAVAAAGAPVAVTVDLEAAAGHVHALVDQLATTVRLPVLREMREHIPRLVEAVLAGLDGPERATRFSSDALQLFVRWSWPGNVAELRRTVELVARRMPGRTVGAGDLPDRMQHGGAARPLTLMESAERDAIVAALRRCGGNRTRAAEALGIGRTTLYRKLVLHRLES